MPLDRKHISHPDFLVMRPLLTKIVTKEHGGTCPWKQSNILHVTSCFLYFFRFAITCLERCTASGENAEQIDFFPRTFKYQHLHFSHRRGPNYDAWRGSNDTSRVGR